MRTNENRVSNINFVRQSLLEGVVFRDKESKGEPAQRNLAETSGNTAKVEVQISTVRRKKFNEKIRGRGSRDMICKVQGQLCESYFVVYNILKVKHTDSRNFRLR